MEEKNSKVFYIKVSRSIFVYVVHNTMLVAMVIYLLYIVLYICYQRSWCKRTSLTI